MSRRIEASDENAKKLARKIESHTFANEDGPEYNQSEFGGFKDYFTRKRIKLQNRDAHLRSQVVSLGRALPQLFRGLVMHVNGYTVPNQRELSKLIVTHGGGYQQYFGGKTFVTHIIASNLTPKKKIEFARYKVVKPEWVLDCIASGKLLPWVDYRLFDATPGQKNLDFYSIGSGSGAMKNQGLSGMREVIDRTITIPASDDEEDEQLPNSQPEGSFQDEVDVEQDNFPLPSRQADPVPGSSFENIVVEREPALASNGESEEAVSLVLIPPTIPKSLKEKSHKSVLSRSNESAFQFTSSPPPPTFQKPPSKKTHLHKVPAEREVLPRPGPIEIVDGEAHWAAECIIGQRKHFNRKKPKLRRGWTQYWIRWQGFPDDEATWEFEKLLLKDVGKQGLADFVTEWQHKAHRQVGNALIFAEIPREVLEKFTKARKGIPKDYEEWELDNAFAGVMQSSSPGGMIVVKHPTGDIEPGKIEVPLAIDPYNGISGSLSPRNFMSEEEMVFLKQSVLSERDVPSNKLAREATQSVNRSISKSFEYGSPVDFRELCEEEAPSRSFEFGTPVDFIGSYEGPIQADSDIAKTPKPMTEDICLPIDPMDLHDEEADLRVSADDVFPMSEVEFLTPRDELEEYDAHIHQGSPTASQPSGQLSNTQPRPPPKAEQEMNPEELMVAFLANPGIRAQTVLGPDFIKNYFKHSRLHHLSTWKAKIRAELQDYTQNLKPLKTRPRRYILHVDFDCFFASVSTRDRPDLAGKPVAIAHGSGSDNSMGAEIAACNYPARAFGITAGMWMSRAKGLCPSLIVLGYDFPEYEKASKVFYEVMRSVGAERIHAGSVDEALLDISNLCCDVGLKTEEEEENRAAEIAEEIRDRCRQNTGGLEVSVGIGGNILLAKLAMKKAKPAGQYLLRNTKVAEFMNNVAVRDLPGIGPNTAKKVEEKFGTNKVGDIRKISKERLKDLLSEKTGGMMWEYCRGFDQKVVGEMTTRKSISVDVNWGVRFESQKQAETFIMKLAKEAESRMKAECVKGKHLTLTAKQRAAHAPFKPSKHLGHGECDTVTKSILLGVSTSNSEIIGKKTVAMLRAMGISPWELRGLGLTVARLQEVQAGKAESSQQTLDFKGGPVEQEPVKGGQPMDMRENVPPWDRPLPKAYVKRPVSLLDSYFTPTEKTQLVRVPQGTMGTQFEIPENVDAEVMPFLPTQIRESICQKAKGSEALRGQEQTQLLLQEPSQESLSQPPNSQDDVSVWRALPVEMRAILRVEHEQEQERLRMAREKRPPSPSKGKRQSLLPQSPRKGRSLPWSGLGTTSPSRGSRKIYLPPMPTVKAPSTPTRKRHGRPPAAEAGPSRIRSNTNPDRILDMRGNDVSGWLFDEGGIDRDYYYAVPEEDRQQIVSDAVKHHEARLEETRRQQRKEAAEHERMANAVRLVVPDRQITLKDGIPVGTLAQIKEFLARWYDVWAGEGPRKDYAEEFEDSVVELETFLKKLVVEERSLPKADEAVRFFLVLVEGEDQGQWKLVLWRFVKAINDGLVELGMGPIDFGFEDGFYDLL